MVAVAIANQKGGVGKTTVTLGLAEAAAGHGLNVLVVDCDPQSNLSSALVIEIGENSSTLAELLDNEIILDETNRSQFIFESSWNETLSQGKIEVIVASPRLTTIESHLAADPIGACDRLQRGIETVSRTYDLVLFDCPPSVGLLTINALFAADEVIVVSSPSAWSLDGVESFMNNVERIASRRSGKPNISGIVVNNVGRTRDGKYWESELLSRYKDAVISIPSKAAIAEASAMSSPLRSLGSRPGAKEACEHFNSAFLKLIGLNIGLEKTSNIQPLASKQEAKSIAAAV